MTTTILGANGKLGSVLTQFARADGLDWRTQARHGPADVIWSGAFDDPALAQVVSPGATLINMIGQTAVTQSGFDDVNVRFVEDLLEAAIVHRVAHVVLISSAAVYGEGTGVAFTEDAVLRPVNAYGTSKATMEGIALATGERATAPAITILRIGNVAGADALMQAARRHIAAGTAMDLHRFCDGCAPLRSYIGPRDLFDTIRALAMPHRGPPRVINVAHPVPVTLDALLSAYKTHALPDLHWIDSPIPDGIPRRVTLDTSRMQSHVKLAQTDNPADDLGRQLAEYLAL